MQVVALREFTKLIHAMEGNTDVVRPGVVGDLILTCGSKESRNYQYGYRLAKGEDVEELMSEGAQSAEAIAAVSKKYGAHLPLAESVFQLVCKNAQAHRLLYQSLGFRL